MPEGYENSSDDSKTSTTYKQNNPAKVPVPNVLPNDGSSSDNMTLVPLEDKFKVEQVLTYNREAAKEMIDNPENIIVKIKLAKDSENTVEGYISKDTNFRSNKS